MDLKDKTVLITGSTDGVGRVVAEKLGASGAHILVHGRDAMRGKAVVAAIEAAGGKAELLVADLSSLAEVRRLAEAVRARTTRLDILINNAGVGTAGGGAKRQVSA
ncbi:MAG: SDR family NAD(P)-dependent oxidoreductase, partial [Mesorhizobium sp.]